MHWVNTKAAITPGADIGDVFECCRISWLKIDETCEAVVMKKTDLEVSFQKVINRI